MAHLPCRRTQLGGSDVTGPLHGFRIGVDIGGTFTDVIGRRGDRVFAVKVPSSPENPAAGVLAGVEAVLELSGEDAGETSTASCTARPSPPTRSSRRRARASDLLMTEGFEDVLEIGRQKRSRMYDLFMVAGDTGVSRPGTQACRELRSVLVPTAPLVVPLDEAAVRSTVTRLVEEEGIEAVAVCYLFSFRNPAHERRTADLIARDFPGPRGLRSHRRSIRYFASTSARA